MAHKLAELRPTRGISGERAVQPLRAAHSPGPAVYLPGATNWRRSPGILPAKHACRASRPAGEGRRSTGRLPHRLPDRPAGRRPELMRRGYLMSPWVGECGPDPLPSSVAPGHLLMGDINYLTHRSGAGNGRVWERHPHNMLCVGLMHHKHCRAIFEVSPKYAARVQSKLLKQT